MKVLAVAAALLLAAAAVHAQSYNDPPPSPLDLVDEYIGTGSAGWGIGHNNPAAQLPFAPLRLGPDTSKDALLIPWNHFGGYYYRDSHIRAFSHTHVVGAGLPDFGNFGVMPLSVAEPTDDLIKRHNYRSTFSHDTEVIYPGFYSVYVDGPQTRVELTAAGNNAGMHRYTFTPGKPMALLLDVCHHVSTSDNICIQPSVSISVNDGAVEFTAYLRNKGSLTGRNGKGVDMWLYGRFHNVSASSLAGAGIWSDGVVQPGVLEGNSTTESLGAYFYFGDATESAQSLVLSVGLSFLDAAGARNNHDAQVAQRTFDDAKAAAVGIWRAALDGIVLGLEASESTKVKFYTALYRTLMSPTKYNEADGRYLGMDEAVHTVEPGHDYFSDMSLWDTFRTQNPWLVLAQPAVALDVARSLTTMYLQGGSVPRWPIANVYTACMFGDNANMVLLDTYIKGLVDFNFTAVYVGMRNAGLAPQAQDGRGGLAEYLQYGYIPIEADESGVCSALAYAYNDWAIARAAELLGHEDDRALFDARAQNYRNHFEPESQFMCNRYMDGTFECPKTNMPYNPGYVEGNQWHYFLDVPHDIEGLLSLYPSAQVFVDKLEYNMQASTETSPVFNLNYAPNPFYWAGNEHDLLFPWLFNKAGRADRTQYWTRWLLEHRYTTGPEGLPGNDDYGTMSAWYTFGALGFYPITGADYYLVGSPAVDRATLMLCGREVTVTAVNNSADNVYVKSVTLNGVPLEHNELKHSVLCGVAEPLEIVFTMTDVAGGFM